MRESERVRERRVFIFIQREREREMCTHIHAHICIHGKKLPTPNKTVTYPSFFEVCVWEREKEKKRRDRD